MNTHTWREEGENGAVCHSADDVMVRWPLLRLSFSYPVEGEIATKFSKRVETFEFSLISALITDRAFRNI